MNSSTTTKTDSSHSFQPMKAHCFEQFLSPGKSNIFDQIKGICRKLHQKPGVHSIIAMDSAGFHYTNNGDTVHCDTCGLEVSGWTLNMNPFTIHAQRSPKCSYVCSMLPDKISPLPSIIGLTLSGVDATSFRRQKIESTHESNQRHTLDEINRMRQIRKRTFSHWPHRTSPSSEQMIEAGFFSCNVGDRVICLYCNLICEQWIPNTDNPWEVHKKLFPKCPYVIAMSERKQASLILFKNGTVASVTHHTAYLEIPRYPIVEHVCWFSLCAYAKQLCTRELYRNNQKSKLFRQECGKLYNKKIISRLVEARLDLPISTSLVAEGFDLLIIKSCYENQLQLTHDDFVDDSDLRVACIILQKQIEYINGKKENIIIPSVAMIKIHVEMSILPQDVRSEMNAQDQQNESTPTNLCLVSVTDVKRLTCGPCDY